MVKIQLRYQTARNAKCCKSISVLSGGFTKEELKDTDIIIKDISEIFTVIEWFLVNIFLY